MISCQILPGGRLDKYLIYDFLIDFDADQTAKGYFMSRGKEIVFILTFSL